MSDKPASNDRPQAGATVRPLGLSKSKITAFEQCAKKLWLSRHRSEVAEVDPGAEARFDAGHFVGEIACRLHGAGVMVEVEPDLAAAVAATRALMEEDATRPIFEATFEHDNVLVRVDVLEPTAHGWLIAEVKSSAGVKEYHLGDLATQIWVLQQAGVAVRRATATSTMRRSRIWSG